MVCTMSESRQKFRFHLVLGAIFTLSVAYLAIVPPNAGPDEIVHARSSWYLAENPSKIFSKEFIVTSELPGELRILDTTHEFDNTACFTQRNEVPPSCQNLEVQEEGIERYYIFYHSIPYYLFVGISQHASRNYLDAYTSAKLASFTLCWLILLFALTRIRIKLIGSNLTLLFFLISSSSIFLLTVVNPSSFEIVSALYFASSILCIRDNYCKTSLAHFFLSATLLTLSRPLGFVWLMCIILFYQTIASKGPRTDHANKAFAKSVLPLAVLFVTQIWLGHDWPSPLRYEKANLEFYIEESIREFNESGHWYAHFFGVLGAGELKLPVLFVYFNILATLLLIKQSASVEMRVRRRQYFVISLSLFFVPAAIQLINSAAWPVWWQGRYLIPVFVGLILLHICSSERNLHGQIPYFKSIAVLGVASHAYMAILTFARFNWGLYPTSTPVIANGWSMSSASTLIFFSCFLIFLIISWVTLNIGNYIKNLISTLIIVSPNFSEVLNSLFRRKHGKSRKSNSKK